MSPLVKYGSSELSENWKFNIKNSSLKNYRVLLLTANKNSATTLNVFPKK